HDSDETTKALCRAFAGLNAIDRAKEWAASTSDAGEAAASRSVHLAGNGAEISASVAPGYDLSAARMAPMPMLVDALMLRQMQEVADALNVAVPAFVHAWHKDVRFRSLVRIPRRIEDLFLQNPPPSTPQALGTMRPDLLLCQN